MRSYSSCPFLCALDTHHNILTHKHACLGIHRGAVSGHSSECACHIPSTHQWQLHKPSQVSQSLPPVPSQPDCKYSFWLSLFRGIYAHEIVKLCSKMCLTDTGLIFTVHANSQSDWTGWLQWWAGCTGSVTRFSCSLLLDSLTETGLVLHAKLSVEWS